MIIFINDPQERMGRLEHVLVQPQHRDRHLDPVALLQLPRAVLRRRRVQRAGT